mmetsp:Transcript_3883/g.13741  ORF Transcript_3883/g.13741 Transcript_3883/m.13741 type:complete len:201 (-) Transcript_3883:4897-5499(-)
MVESNTPSSSAKPSSVRARPWAKVSASTSAWKHRRSICRPMDSSRQPSSRVMRSVCAPVIAARWVSARASTLSTSVSGGGPGRSSTARRCCSNCAAVSWISRQASGDKRSRSAWAQDCSARRSQPTLVTPEPGSRAVSSARSKPRGSSSARGALAPTRPWRRASASSSGSIGGGIAPRCTITLASMTWRASRAVFSDRSV